MSEFVFDTKLSLKNYLTVVNTLADDFLTDGVYSPQFGDISAMNLFYVYCVKASDYDDKYPHTAIVNINGVETEAPASLDLDALEELAGYTPFMNKLHQSINCDEGYLTFGDAYRTGVEIAKEKARSFAVIVERINAGVKKIVESLANSFTEENLKTISDLADKIASGDLSVQAIVDAYGNSNRVEEIANRMNRPVRIGHKE